jgi:glucokinase
MQQATPFPGRVVADVGGTNTRIALVGDDGTMQHLARLRNDDHAGLAEALAAWRQGLPAGHAPLEDAALAVAAPIVGEEIALTNRPAWRFTRDSLRRALGLPGPLHLVNDFTAVALSLPRLEVGDLLVLGEPRCAAPLTPTRAPVVVLGPGSGLGVSALVPHAAGCCAVASEGGHATLAVHDAAEARLVDRIREREGHVSAETLLCGPGLLRLHAAVAASARGSPTPATPSDVVRLADAGDPGAEQTLETFFALLGGFAGDVALAFGAWEGVFLAGGILPQLQERLVASAFRERFEAKGDYAGLLASVPVALVTAPEPALAGLSTFRPALLAGAAAE